MKTPVILLLCLTLTGCMSERTVRDLDEKEQVQLNDLLMKRKSCIANESARMDDGSADVSAISQAVAWKCGHYVQNINDLLYKEFDFSIGEAWGYTNKLEESSPNEATDIIMQRRRLKQGMN